MRKRVNQVRLKLAHSATEASMRLEILVTETRDITLSRQQTTKALIRLRLCCSHMIQDTFSHDPAHMNLSALSPSKDSNWGQTSQLFI